VNKLTLVLRCGHRIGRADIEESKSGIALNAPPPQASYPCGNFSDTSSRKKEIGNILKYFYKDTICCKLPKNFFSESWKKSLPNKNKKENHHRIQT